MSSCRTTSGPSMRAYSCIASAATTGSPIPAALFRVATDSTMAIAVMANIGGRTDSQANVTGMSAYEGRSCAPDRPTSGPDPMISRPAAMLLTARTPNASSENPSAAATLPANTSERAHERVSSVFHVPYRSSAENTSPPTMLVNAGSTHNAANPRTTSGSANPDSFTERPNSVSSGRLFCTRIAAAKANGPTTHAASVTRVLIWADSFEHSAPATAAMPLNLTTPAPSRAFAGARCDQSPPWCEDRRWP